MLEGLHLLWREQWNCSPATHVPYNGIARPRERKDNGHQAILANILITMTARVDNGSGGIKAEEIVRV